MRTHQNSRNLKARDPLAQWEFGFAADPRPPRTDTAGPFESCGWTCPARIIDSRGGAVRVKDLMTREARGVLPETSVREASLLLRKLDCGILPVLAEGRVAAVITDRDLCLALGERDCRPSELPVGDVMSRSLWACREEDDVAVALDTMRARRVRRLPVLDAEGALVGIVSLNDVFRRAEPGGEGRISDAEAVRTLQAIGEHRYPRQKEHNADVTALSEFV